MAGIGFELNRLVQQDNLKDVARAYVYTALAAVGPWVYTVCVLAFITSVQGSGAESGLTYFRTIIVYNFSVSLVLTAPIFMVATRVLSDAIFAYNVTAIPTTMQKCIWLAIILNLPIGVLWYMTDFYILDVATKITAFANLMLISIIWVLAVFLLALKDYMSVSKAFLWGHLASFFLIWFSTYFSSDALSAFWLLLYFNIGLVIIVCLLIARIWAEYPYRYNKHFKLTPFFIQYWPLALGGLFYNAAIWADKWLMWFAPESVQLPSLMRFFPAYDHAMFLSILCTVPAFVLFIVVVETNFFNHYQRFYGDILSHRPLKRIMRRHGDLLESVHDGSRQLMLTQALFTLLFIAFAPFLVHFLHGTYAETSILRLGALGGFFHLLMLAATIILSYFDCRKQVMWVYLLFLVLNVIFTIISIQSGFAYYGYGYFFAALISFVCAAIILFLHLKNLLYHSFITNNLSVRNLKLASKVEEQF